MTRNVSIVVHNKKTMRSLNAFEKSQYPFALAHALTKTAGGAQRQAKRMTANKFDLHSKFVTQNIRITPAKKSDIVNYGFAGAQVRTDKKISRFMVQHEPGAMRRPLESSSISVPMRALQNIPGGYRTRGGRVMTKYTPQRLLKGKKGKKGKRSILRNPFIMKGRGGTAIIARREGLKRKPLEYLYKFESTVKIKKRWGFVNTVRRFAKVRMKKNLERSLSMAVRSIR